MVPFLSMVPDDEVPMEETLPGRCPRCRATLSPRTDRATRKPITRGHRALLECRACGVMEIGPNVAAARSRFTLIRWLMSIGAAAGVLMTAGFELARTVGPASGWFMVLFFAAAAAAMVFMLTRCVAHALSPEVPLGVRFENWFLAAFWAAPLVLIIWALFGWFLPQLRAGSP
jgi:hypothetical protein